MNVIRGGEPRFVALVAVVVMDDHVHALVRPEEGSTARRLVTAWKGISAHRLCSEFPRVGPVWQRGYFDRWMRDPAQTQSCRTYVIENPTRRWPDVAHYPWMFVR